MDCEIGSSISFDDVVKKHDALLIATGVYKSRKINLNNSNASNVVPALEFLIASNKKGLQDTVKDFENGRLDSKDKNVLVVGGGDTAMDCLRTAVRQGAKSIKCLYRRDQNNMPGSQREVQNAIEEGVDFKWLTLPVQYLGNKIIEKVRIVKMQLGSPDESGRRSIEPIYGSEENFDADLVIEALGFMPENLPKMFNKDELQVTQWGTLKINFKTMMTSLHGIFAAGDIVRGASLVVWGIKDGRDAAENIHNFLLNKENSSNSIKYESEDKVANV